ncbi:MAG: hypothetical protein AAGH53_07770 [Pseudomonadota bacterium]
MSLSVVEEEVRRFLSDPSPEVLCIKGKWGVGKTFGWRTFLRKARDDQKLALDRYAYVSLFGLNSYEELRYALFERTVSGKDIGEDPTPSTLKSVIKDRDIWRKFKPVAEAAARIFNMNSVTDALAKGATLFVREQLVCLDDLERAGEGLRTREIMGLASLLKEERKCKVVLLLNDEEHNDKDEFDAQLEKVADVTLTFAPTAIEAANIALDHSAPFADMIRPRIEQLGITNIRVIRKIERLADRLGNLLTDYDHAIVNDSIATLVLASWSVQQPKLAPSVDIMRRYNTLAMAIKSDEETVDPELKRFKEIISDYPFNYANDLDKAVIDGAEAGYFVEAEIKKAATEVEAFLKANTRNSALSQAWEKLYHGSLATEDDEFLDAVHAGAIKDAAFVTPVNLNSAIYILRVCGREQQALEVLSAYMEAHKDELPEFFDLSPHFLGEGDVEEILVEAFANARANYVDPRDPFEVLKHMGEKRGWDRRDAMLMAKQSVDDFESMFEALEGDQIRNSIEILQSLGRSQQEGSEEVEKSTTEALRRIAVKSSLRARKVARFGVTLDEENYGE